MTPCHMTKAKETRVVSAHAGVDRAEELKLASNADVVGGSGTDPGVRTHYPRNGCRMHVYVMFKHPCGTLLIYYSKYFQSTQYIVRPRPRLRPRPCPHPPDCPIYFPLRARFVDTNI